MYRGGIAPTGKCREVDAFSQTTKKKPTPNNKLERSTTILPSLPTSRVPDNVAICKAATGDDHQTRSLLTQASSGEAL